MQIGFLLLTHAHEAQILRLTETLSATFGNPPIVCHHDFSRESLNLKRFPSDVKFITKYTRTKWGHVSVVEAILKALRLLYDGGAPDWFCLLSGSDYPIKSGTRVLEELSHSPYDAYMNAIMIDHTQVPEQVGGCIMAGFDSPHYPLMAYDRYISRRIPIQSSRRSILVRNPKVLAPFHPFSAKYRCYSGDLWFTGNSRVAEILLSSDHRRLFRYFKHRITADEALLHTILGNRSDLRLNGDTRRYIRWEYDAHPKVLDQSDLLDLLQSGAHFARKFAPDSPVLDEIDRLLGIDTRSHRVMTL